jgi:hypothetical protein
MLDLDARHPWVRAQAHGERVQAGAPARPQGDEMQLRDAEAGGSRTGRRRERRRGHAGAGRRAPCDGDQQAAGLRRLRVRRGCNDEPDRGQAQ